MKKRNLGQLMLIVAVIIILVSGVSIWLGYKWFDKSISSAVFVIAMILIGVGAYLSKGKISK